MGLPRQSGSSRIPRYKRQLILNSKLLAMCLYHVLTRKTGDRTGDSKEPSMAHRYETPSFQNSAFTQSKNLMTWGSCRKFSHHRAQAKIHWLLRRNRN